MSHPYRNRFRSDDIYSVEVELENGVVVDVEVEVEPEEAQTWTDPGCAQSASVIGFSIDGRVVGGKAEALLSRMVYDRALELASELDLSEYGEEDEDY